MSQKVLVVEDEVELRDYLTSVLQGQGFVVEGVGSGEQAIRQVEVSVPNIILMDFRLPGKNGVETIKDLKANARFTQIPVIMVTGVDTEDDKVAALEVGADDYVVKPFQPKELGARIKAVLRRSDTRGDSEEILRDKGLIIDLQSHKVTLNEEDVYLTLTEFRIISELLKQKGRVLSRDLLRQNALGNLNVTDRTIDVHMASLRKKLEPFAQSIQTVRGVGYRYNI